MKRVTLSDIGPAMFDLVDAAAAVQRNGFAPYSRYLVGAAVMDEENNIWRGCNVENAAYLVIHAEAGAIANMVQGGGKRITAVACVTRDGGACCGDCRQKIWEMCDGNKDVPIYLFDLEGRGMIVTIDELLPFAFDLKNS